MDRVPAFTVKLPPFPKPDVEEEMPTGFALNPMMLRGPSTTIFMSPPLPEDLPPLVINPVKEASAEAAMVRLPVFTVTLPPLPVPVPNDSAAMAPPLEMDRAPAFTVTRPPFPEPDVEAERPTGFDLNPRMSKAPLTPIFMSPA